MREALAKSQRIAELLVLCAESDALFKGFIEGWSPELYRGEIKEWLFRYSNLIEKLQHYEPELMQEFEGKL